MLLIITIIAIMIVKKIISQHKKNKYAGVNIYVPGYMCDNAKNRRLNDKILKQIYR